MMIGFVAALPGMTATPFSAFRFVTRLGLQADLRADLVADAGLRRAVEHVLEEEAVAAADVEARIAAVAEVARASLPGSRTRLNTPTAPRLISSCDRGRPVPRSNTMCP